MSGYQELIPEDILAKFEIHNYNHAVEILAQSFPNEFIELLDCLRSFEITLNEIKESGGNESSIPPKFASVLDPLGWKEIRITGDLIIRFYPRKGTLGGRFDDVPYDSRTIANYIDGHNIDFVKGRVACDIEWNSKDQTFDRDLFALRTYHECDIISAAVIVTRSAEMNEVFRSLGRETMQKYGASTTWMGKLLPRLDSRRHGSCPVLAIGITPASVKDWRSL